MFTVTIKETKQRFFKVVGKKDGHIYGFDKLHPTVEAAVKDAKQRLIAGTKGSVLSASSCEGNTATS